MNGTALVFELTRRYPLVVQPLYGRVKCLRIIDAHGHSADDQESMLQASSGVVVPAANIPGLVDCTPSITCILNRETDLVHILGFAAKVTDAYTVGIKIIARENVVLVNPLGDLIERPTLFGDSRERTI